MKINAKVLTIRRLDFTTDKNEEIKGYQVWLLAPTDNKSWTTHEVLKCWVPDTSPNAGDAAALLPDDLVSFEFNRYGKPVITDFCPASA